MFCLSKGLGAPVGSMLVGSRDHITRARAIRKALGGGMRQAGILAAAGLLALEDMPARLPEDHRNARLLAEAVALCPAAEIDLDTVQTNIVIFRLRDQGNAAAFVAKLRDQGILTSAIGPHAVRFVTHMDVSAEQCRKAARICTDALTSLVSEPLLSR